MILLAFAAATLAQPAATPAHPAHHAAPAPAAAAATRFSVNTTKIADLMSHAAAKAAVDSVLPGFSGDPRVAMAGQFTLKALQPMAQGAITDAHLEAIEKALAAIPAA